MRFHWMLAALILGAAACGPREEPAAPAAETPAAEDHSAHTPAPAEAVDAPTATVDPNTSTHQDHDARHGGTFFMVADGYHHIEGTYPRAGRFQLYAYDDHTRAIPAEPLSGWVEVDTDPTAKRHPLRFDASCDCLVADIEPAPAFPAQLSARVQFPVRGTGTGEPYLYNFEFPEATQEDQHH
ncbi:MAG TPA: hypothetical protein VMW27_13840 [Thermoanaerobaculia bacterium]|nr:hypothetical protein [Thermoanaerobaculia bacterium]